MESCAGDYEPQATMIEKRVCAAFAPLVALALVMVGSAAGQVPSAGPATHNVDELVAIALEANPAVLAAQQRVDAAEARIASSGAFPDPFLGLGVMNMPVLEPGYGDEMTMNAVTLAQSVPFPGKRALARRTAELEREAARSELEQVRLATSRDVRIAYYRIALRDRSLEILARSQRLLLDLIASAESRYAVGTGGQDAVLVGRVETAHLAVEAAELSEQRRADIASLNGLLARNSDAALTVGGFPPAIVALAIPETGEIRFASAALGSRLESSPLPDIGVLEARALAASPMLRMHEARIEAQETRVELARRGHLPDFDLSLTWGQRFSHPDMVSVMVMIPLPVHRASRQDAGRAEQEAVLASMRAEHDALVYEIRSELARLVGQIEAQRSRLALLVGFVLPQAAAALESSTASFQVGRTDFRTVLQNQAAVYNYETDYHRALGDFAIALAELNYVVGEEVLP